MTDFQEKDDLKWVLVLVLGNLKTQDFEKKTFQLFKKKKKHFLMTYHLIGNNLRKKELVVIESKQKLQHNTTPFHFCTFNVIHFKKSVYELQYYVSKCFVMLKIYALELCDQILQTKS